MADNQMPSEISSPYNGSSGVFFLWFAYTSYRGTTWYSKSKTKPLCFLPENLENFLQKKIFFSANLDSASKVENWFYQPPPPPQDMGILDFSKFELSIKFPRAPPPPSTWEFWILANLNPASKFHEPPPPPPTFNMGILDFSKFELSIKIPWAPPPTLNMGILDFSKFELSIKISWAPPTHPQHGNFGF